MAGPFNQTYTSLLTSIPTFLERQNDVQLAAALPELIALAENRIATDAKILGTQEVLTGTFVANNPVVAKPAYWRRTQSMNYTDATGARTELLLRTYEWCRDYWPNPSEAGDPRYYADYSFTNFLIVATPSADFAFELIYIRKIAPLSGDSTTNWLTINAPQLMLNAALLECDIWLKNLNRIGQRQGSYQESLTAFQTENASRVVDRNIVIG